MIQKNASSVQGIHSLLTECSIKIKKIPTQNGNRPVCQLITAGNFFRLKWVNMMKQIRPVCNLYHDTRHFRKAKPQYCGQLN